MAHSEDGNQGPWQPPRDPSLHHLSTHTPTQTPRQPDGTSPAGFNPMQHQTPWRFQPPFGGMASAQQTPILSQWSQQSNADWPTAPAAANNNTMGAEWEKWSSNGTDLARPMPQLGLVIGHANLPAPSSPMVNQTVKKEERMDHSGGGQERQSTERRSTSYELSPSQTPSDSEMETKEHTNTRTTENQTEEHIDVTTTPTPTAPAPKEETEKDKEDHLMVDDTSEVSTTTPETNEHKEEEASKLLLNFSQQLSIPREESRIAFAPSQEDSKTGEFAHSDHSAFTNPDQHTTPTSTSSPEASNGLCRPPGLGPALFPPPSGHNAPLVCPLCGFSCNSKFHYNSHMNTHGDHQCCMCDYTSRTEGRLKKHMRDSHTLKEQIEAGLEVQPPLSTPMSSDLPGPSHAFRPIDTSNLSTTMASLVDAANAAAAGTSQNTTSSSAFSLENMVSSSSILNTLAPTGLPSALDQIRAFAERSSLMAEGSANLANALGDMAQQLPEEDPDQPGPSNRRPGPSRMQPSPSGNAEPRRNSNGKIKQLKCKQCPHISYSKDEHWAHARTHIAPEKQLNCPHCNFVTEYKHHLEYHIANHFGKKPFKCPKCAYRCVNKSMLNSHLKSHSNFYNFKCRDCTYATKYPHSLKLHLKKYDHNPVGPLPSGTSPQPAPQPRPEPAYLNRFIPPPLPPPTTLAQSLGLPPPTSQSLNYASQMLLRQHQMEQMNLINLNGLAGLPQHPHLNCAICDYQAASQDDLMRHNVTHFMANTGASPIVSFYQSLPQMAGLLPAAMQSLQVADQAPTADSRESGNACDDEMVGGSGSTGTPSTSPKTGSGEEKDKKCKGCKVDQIGERLLAKSPAGSESASHCEGKDGEEHMEESGSPSDPLCLSQEPSTSRSAFAQMRAEPPSLNIFQQACLQQLNSVLNQGRHDESWTFQCPHCRMAFQEQALYQIHMGYHGYEHKYKCNRCGFTANDALSFNLHLLEASHK